MDVVIYARYSSHNQREESIERQLETCHAFCQQNGYTVVQEYIDRAFSATTDQRPAFQKMIADSANKLFQYVVVYRLDRFSRKRFDSITYKAVLQKNGVRVLSALENISDDPSGILLESVLEGLSEYYSKELSKKIIEGMKKNGEKCKSTGGYPPLGYKVGADKCFEIDPATAPIVQKIFEMYADGNTVAEIIVYLNKMGYKTSKGVAFNKNSLHTLLHNKKYIGIYTYKGEEYPGGIPRIVSDELFDKVDALLRKNKMAPARRKAKVEYLLTTKLFCGHCKRMMTGFSATGKQGRKYHYYICNGVKARPKECNKKMVKKDYIEDLVVAECRRLLSAENIRRISKAVVSMLDAERDMSDLKRLKKLLADNEKKRENTINAIMESDIESVRKALGEKIPILEQEHAELEKQIAEEAAPYPTITETEVRFFLTSLKKGKVNDMKYRKMLIDTFVNRIYLYDDRLTITYNSGDEPVTISDQLLSTLEAREEKYHARFEEDKDLFLNSGGPPNGHWTNTYYFRGGFAVMVQFQ